MTDDQFQAWLEDSSAQRVTLYEAEVLSDDVEIMRYFSNRHYSFGDPAHPYLAAVSLDLKIVEAISRDGSARLSAGKVGIWSVDGARDAWLDDVWKNRAIRAYVGDVRWQRSDFRLAFVGVMEDVSGSENPDQIMIEMRDITQRINAPVSEVLLPDGSICPVTVGEAANVTLRLKNAVTREYAYHAGASEGVIEPRGEAKPRTAFTEDVSAGTITFLTNTEVGLATASVQGDKSGGIYRCTIGAIVRLLVTAYGEASRRFVDAEIDTANFDAFEAAHPQKVGLHMPERINVIEACHALTKSVQAYLIPSRVGKLRLIQWGIPSISTSDILPRHYVDQSLKPITRHPVVAAVKIGYSRNYTPQPSLQTSIPDEHKALFAATWRTKTVVDEAARTRYKLSAEPVLSETCLNNEDDASAEAARRLAQEGVPRTTYALEGTPPTMLLELGQGVTLYGSRYGMQAGKLGQVTLLAFDLGTYNTDIEVTV